MYMRLCCRASRTAVLALRGSNSMEDLLTDIIDRPVAITDWLPGAFVEVSDMPHSTRARWCRLGTCLAPCQTCSCPQLVQEFPECASDVFAHMGMYTAAKAVLQVRTASTAPAAE